MYVIPRADGTLQVKPQHVSGQTMRLSSANPCSRAHCEHSCLSETPKQMPTACKLKLFSLWPSLQTQLWNKNQLLLLQQMPPRPRQIFHTHQCDSTDLCRVNHRSESTLLPLSKLSLLLGLKYLPLPTQLMFLHTGSISFFCLGINLVPSSLLLKGSQSSPLKQNRFSALDNLNITAYFLPSLWTLGVCFRELL